MERGAVSGDGGPGHAPARPPPALFTRDLFKPEADGFPAADLGSLMVKLAGEWTRSDVDRRWSSR